MSPYHPSCFSPRFGVSGGPPRGPGRLRLGAAAGFTVMEVCVAGAIITIFLASLFALNSNMMRLLRAASEAANASQDLQARVEQLRLANWTQITDPVWLGKNLYTNNNTDAKINLPGMSETTVVEAYASPASAPPASSPPSFTITHLADGSVQYPTNYAYGSALAQQEMIRIDVTITWPSLSRSRSRTLTTLVSRWGISK